MPIGQGVGLVGEIKTPASPVFEYQLRKTEAALRGAQGLLADKAATQHPAAR
jgi:hypothetical protein